MPDHSPSALNECALAYKPDERKFLFISPNVKCVLGYDIADFYQNPALLYEMIDPPDRDRIRSLSDDLSVGDWIEFTYQVVTGNGELKSVYEKRTVTADQHSGCKVLLSIIKDRPGSAGVKQGKKRSLEEEIWAKNNLEALIDNTEDLIWSINKERKYLFTNNAYRDKFFSDTGIIPKKGDHVYGDADYQNEVIQEWEGYYTRAFHGETFTTRSESIDKGTQQPVYFEISFNPFYQSGGEITGIGCFARNITDLIKKEKAIIDQNQRLRHIASVSSHELRRPVASLLGLINIMDKENFYNPDNETIIEHLLTVGQEIDNVIRLIVNQTFTDDVSDDKYQLP